jgi:pimeloyl-ACP methyl ester carboxylesterase
MAGTGFNRRSLVGTALAALASASARAAPTIGPYEVEGGQFKSFDGTQLFFRRTGKGPPVLLLHGLLGDAPRTWFSTGVAQSLAAAGFTAIAPDARAHGLSAAPTDPQAYPKDVEAMDVEALMRFLDLGQVRVVGYGLGSHTAIRLMARGGAVERGVLGGIGDRNVTQTEELTAKYQEAILNARGGRDPVLGVVVQAAIRLQNLNPRALALLLDSGRSTPPAALARIRTPLLVITGRTDRSEGTAERLAHLLGEAQAEHVAGSHLDALRDRRFARLTTAFLRSRSGPAQFEAERG